MDVEKYKRKTLKGVSQLLSRKDIHNSVLIYHLKDNEEVTSSLLRKYNENIIIVPGHLSIEMDLGHLILRF